MMMRCLKPLCRNEASLTSAEISKRIYSQKRVWFDTQCVINFRFFFFSVVFFLSFLKHWCNLKWIPGHDAFREGLFQMKSMWHQFQVFMFQQKTVFFLKISTPPLTRNSFPFQSPSGSGFDCGCSNPRLPHCWCKPRRGMVISSWSSNGPFQQILILHILRCNWIKNTIKSLLKLMIPHQKKNPNQSWKTMDFREFSMIEPVVL